MDNTLAGKYPTDWETSVKAKTSLEEGEAINNCGRKARIPIANLSSDGCAICPFYTRNGWQRNVLTQIEVSLTLYQVNPDNKRGGVSIRCAGMRDCGWKDENQSNYARYIRQFGFERE